MYEHCVFVERGRLHANDRISSAAGHELREIALVPAAATSAARPEMV
jgi:hypothetical protein